MFIYLLLLYRSYVIKINKPKLDALKTKQSRDLLDGKMLEIILKHPKFGHNALYFLNSEARPQHIDQLGEQGNKNIAMHIAIIKYFGLIANNADLQVLLHIIENLLVGSIGQVRLAEAWDCLLLLFRVEIGIGIGIGIGLAKV